MAHMRGSSWVVSLYLATAKSNFLGCPVQGPSSFGGDHRGLVRVARSIVMGEAENFI